MHLLWCCQHTNNNATSVEKKHMGRTKLNRTASLFSPYFRRSHADYWSYRHQCFIASQMYNTRAARWRPSTLCETTKMKEKRKSHSAHHLMTDILSADVILMLHFWNSTKTEKLNLHLLHVATTAAASLHLPFFSVQWCVVEHWSWIWLVVVTCYKKKQQQ